MAASTSWTEPSLCSTRVTGVHCSGFAKVSGKNDYAFIVETEWSDGRQFFVKRTFGEFQVFQGRLLKSFPELKKAERDKLGLRSGIKDLFVKDKKQLAESREPLVDAYLKSLISLPEKVAQSGIVLSFFESRSSDPKPCKSGVPPPNDIDALLPDIAPIPCYDCCDEIDENGGEQDQGQQAQCQFEDKDVELSSNEDDDYFLDVGLHELMLTSMPQSSDPPTTMCPESMWCSNVDKFSTLLLTIKNSPLTQQGGKPATQPGVGTEDGCESTSFLQSDEEYSSEPAENSDTESQLTEQITDYPDDKIEHGGESPYGKAVTTATGQNSTSLYHLYTDEPA